MHCLKKTIFICLLLFSAIGISSNPIDSLTNLLQTAKDTSRAKLVSEIAWYYLNSDPTKSLELYKEALAVFKSYKNENLIGGVYFNIGLSHYYLRNFDSTKYYYELAREIYEKRNNRERLAKLLGNYGILYDDMGNYAKALQFYLDGLKMCEELKDTLQISKAYNNIGLLYRTQNKLDLALEYVRKAYLIRKNNPQKYKAELASSLLNMGLIYKKLDQLDSSIYYYEKAINANREINDLRRVGLCLNNIGSVYERKKMYSRALSYFVEALEIFQKVNDKYFLSMALLNIGNMQFNLNNQQQSILYLDSALKMSHAINASEVYLECLSVLSEVYNKTGNYEKSFELLSRYAKAKDSIFSETNNKAIAELNQKYEAENKQLEIAKLENTKELEQIRLNRTNTVFYFLAGLALIVSIIVIIAYRNKLLKTRIQKKLSQTNAELTEQKREITDSINYSLQIQQSILPSNEFLAQTLKNYFVLNLPRDIVSGDFYFVDEKNGKIFFSVIDCTGHGVPGALLSFLGMDILQDAIKKNNDTPAKILNYLDAEVNQRLRQSTDVESVKDGMDLAFCTFNPQTLMLEYAGAFNPLYVISDGQLTEIKADKHAIGSNEQSSSDNYKNNTIQLKKDDTVYIFTDGYADQFGGPKGKKFMYKQLKELLLAISNMSMDEQQKILHQKHLEWKGGTFQVDDICIMGFRV